MFAGKAGAYIRVEHLKGASLRQALVLPTNIRLGWKGLTGPNTLAYCKNPLITTVKSFIVQAPGQQIRPVVNFTNILRAAFSYKSFLRSFYVLTTWVCNFWAKGFWHKAAHKMLVNLTPEKGICCFRSFNELGACLDFYNKVSQG
jgi:hypothetical protein